MTRVDEFDNFYAATFHQSVQVAYALCGDRQVAAEATADAYRRAWRDWSKIRDHRPLGFVFTESWKLSALLRGAHPLRKRHEEGSDVELLHALHDLSVDDRRLIVLMTLGDTDLEVASHEVGLTAEEGIENVTQALTRLESTLGQNLDQLERRLQALGRIVIDTPMPPADTIRTKARRGRQRNTVLLVAASVAMIIGGGLAITDGDALATRADLPYRERIGAERPDVVLDAQKLDSKNLLTTEEVAQLNTDEEWEIDSTDEDVHNETPYATCPPRRFANDNPLKVFVRTYKATGQGQDRVAQSIEVARSESGAEKAYRQLVQWYSDCQHPRVQLIDSFTVRRPFGDFRILRLRSYRSGVRTFTVGFSHSGLVTSTLVHEAQGAKGPAIKQFARTLNDSVSRVCVDSGGECTDDIKVMRSTPPPTTEGPEFLGIVDLPPIGKIDRAWAAVPPSKSKKNPAATLCDKAAFNAKGVSKVRSRIFVIPQAKALPKQFGLAQTVAKFGSEERAADFVDTISGRIADCPDANLGASVDREESFEGEGFDASTWRIGFELDEDSRVYFTMALVRRGDRVTQVTFTPAGKYDMSQKAFASIASRAGDRLAHLD